MRSVSHISYSATATYSCSLTDPDSNVYADSATDAVSVALSNTDVGAERNPTSHDHSHTSTVSYSFSVY